MAVASGIEAPCATAAAMPIWVALPARAARRVAAKIAFDSSSVTKRAFGAKQKCVRADATPRDRIVVRNPRVSDVRSVRLVVQIQRTTSKPATTVAIGSAQSLAMPAPANVGRDNASSVHLALSVALIRLRRSAASTVQVGVPSPSCPDAAVPNVRKARRDVTQGRCAANVVVGSLLRFVLILRSAFSRHRMDRRPAIVVPREHLAPVWFAPSHERK
jgi:hypothetical protein